MTSSVIIVSKTAFANRPDVEDEIKTFCIEVRYYVQTIVLVAKPGYLMPLVVLLGERKISYRLEFE
jgi:hypothetical protein